MALSVGGMGKLVCPWIENKGSGGQDRFSIPRACTSTGPLHFGLTPADLLKPHPSRLWNPLIARAFYRRGIIETWGRGTLMMAELTEQAGLAAPEFELFCGDLLVRFRPSRYIAPSRVAHDLSPLQRELLDVLGNHGQCTLTYLRQHIESNAAERTVQKNLAILRDLGMIESRGYGRGARWLLRGTGW